VKRTEEIVQINPGLNIVGQPHVITIHKGVAVSLTFKGIGGQVGKYVFSLVAAFSALPPGMAFADNGDGTATISGTPTAFGDAFPIKIRLENTGPRPIEKSYILRVPALTLQLVQTAPVYASVPLTPGQLKLVANGGSGSGYVYSLTTYAGLVDSTTGYIAPGALPQGTYTDTATVTDSASNSVSVPIAVIVLPPLSIQSSTPPDCEYIVPYSFQFEAAGYPAAPVTYAVTSGALPAGLALSSSGLLSGTPTYHPLSFPNPLKTDTFTITATDSAGFTASATYTTTEWEVLGNAGALYFFVPMVNVLYQNVDVNPLASISGGNGELTYSFTPPGGLDVFVPYANGFIDFKAPAAGVYTIGYTVTDTLGGSYTGTFDITVIDPNAKIQIKKSGVPVGAAGPTDIDFVGSANVTPTTDGVQVTFGTAAAMDIDTDTTLAANSDTRVASQKATKTYVDNSVTGLLDFKGATNCSGNPNYPAASKGDAYVVSTAGKIGGAAGTAVDIGDVFVASADNAGGTQGAVGASWFILEHNLAGALLSANNLSDLASAVTARANLGLGSSAVVDLDIDGTMAANSDAQIPSQKAVVTYVAAHGGGTSLATVRAIAALRAY
jgi:hypothetical protein